MTPPHMVLEVRLLVKLLVTHHTRIGLLSRVDPLVPPQVVRVARAIAAHLTRVLLQTTLILRRSAGWRLF